MRLFAFGSNGSGQLGIGHVEDVSVPTECLFEEDDSNLKRDDAGGHYDGDEDEERRTSATTDAETISSPRRRTLNISRIVAGGNHTLLRCHDGSVYVAGLKLGDDGDDDDGDGAATPLLRFRRIRVMVDEDEQIHGTEDESRMRRMGGRKGNRRFYDKFSHVAATWEASFLVTATAGDEALDGAISTIEQAVFVMGTGHKGELGMGGSVVSLRRPTRMLDFPLPGTKIVWLASGMGHTVVVLSNGDVYGWGGARKGQLGESLKRDKIVWRPTKIDSLSFSVKEAACGREFTILTGDKQSGECVILGSAEDKWRITTDAPSPDLLRGYLSIAASWHGVYVHRHDSSLLAWGRNDRGQLPPLNLPNPRTIAVGSEHALALLQDGTVAAFGWGEHGNCGPETDSQGNVKDTYARIPLTLEEGAEVTGLGGGCATSWIITS